MRQRNKLNGRQDQMTAIDNLRKREIYPEHPERVEMLETHMSVLFLTEQHVYKMKKPLVNSYVDLRSIQDRLHHCEEEVRLNRRLAPNVYDGLVPLTRTDEGEMELSGSDKILEWLVKMRRLPAKRMLDRLINNQSLSRKDIDDLGKVLTDFYRRIPFVGICSRAYIEDLAASLETDRQALADAPYDFDSRYTQVFQSAQEFLDTRHQMLEKRVIEKRIVEGHGDLRPEHICLESPPVIFDCLVFDYRLRLVDPVDELGFLSMECARLGADWVEDVLFRAYIEGTGDVPPQRLLAFYQCSRACRWARLACWRMKGTAEDEKWCQRVEKYMQLATRYCKQLM